MVISSIATLQSAMDMLDRFRGCLLGAAVGDALGMPTEGYTAEEIRVRFGIVEEMMPSPEGHFHFGLQAGQFTDDTEETLLLAESIDRGFLAFHVINSQTSSWPGARPGHWTSGSIAVWASPPAPQWRI